MAYIHHSSPLAGAEFSTVGKLILQQSGPLPYKGQHVLYNVRSTNESLNRVMQYTGMHNLLLSLWLWVPRAS